jgi:hypothetical protein
MCVLACLPITLMSVSLNLERDRMNAKWQVTKSIYYSQLILIKLFFIGINNICGEMEKTCDYGKIWFITTINNNY